MKLRAALDELESAVNDAHIAASHIKSRVKVLESDLAKSIVQNKRALDALKELRVELKDAILTGGQVG